MLFELFTYFTTPCTPQARPYLRGSVAIEARYRRCRQAWQPHLDACKQRIEKAIPETHRKVVILGSGGLLDIPLEILADRFSDVCLVDMVHPKSARKRAKSYANVRLIEADLGGTSVTPFPEQEDADLIVSANLLSQLPLTGNITANDAQALIHTHVERFQNIRCAKLLITDCQRQAIDRHGKMVDQQDMLFGVPLPPVTAEWWWEIAPRPELSRETSWRHRVVCCS